ncbi:MAG: DUF4258 domain-containing protein [Chloroflexota bacterium]|nr:DUF4258 domain-containing protein [Chloroflexota bacterium]
MDDAAAIAEIRLCVEIGDFEMNKEHSDFHMFDEGFTFGQAIRVVVSGAVIEADAQRNRWLFCSMVSGMQQEMRFRGRWLHVCVERDDMGVAIVTMYRPLVRLWRTERNRW